MSNDYFTPQEPRHCNFAPSTIIYNMKTKLTIIIAAMTLASIASEAKTVRRTLNIIQSTVESSETIAPGSLELIYDYHFNADTVHHSSQDNEQMLLQIAPGGISKFSSLRNARIDSIIPTLSPEEIVRNSNRLVNGPSVNIFKNYPAGRLTHTEKIARDWFRYEEDMPQFDWQLGDSTRTIAGYECREARCSFRGRDWTVFYCEEIPVMDGPWKFCGLPGLIMSARDRNSDYSFECIGIRNNATKPLTIYDVPYNITDRRKFYDTLHRYEINPYSYVETVSGIHVTVTDEAGNPNPSAYEPIELSYDFIERDWRQDH